MAERKQRIVRSVEILAGVRIIRIGGTSGRPRRVEQRHLSDAARPAHRRAPARAHASEHDVGDRHCPPRCPGTTRRAPRPHARPATARSAGGPKTARRSRACAAPARARIPLSANWRCRPGRCGCARLAASPLMVARLAQTQHHRVRLGAELQRGAQAADILAIDVHPGRVEHLPLGQHGAARGQNRYVAILGPPRRPTTARASRRRRPPSGPITARRAAARQRQRAPLILQNHDGARARPRARNAAASQIASGALGVCVPAGRDRRTGRASI